MLKAAGVKGTLRDDGAARRESSLFLAGASVIVILTLGYYLLVWGSFSTFISAIDVWNEPFADFQRYYCPMGRAVLTETDPVEGFVYSAFAALLMAPFALLGCEAAVFVWGALLGAGIIAYIWLFRRLVPAGLPFQWMFVGLLLLSFPLLHTFKFGQVTLFSTLAILTALVFVGRGQRGAGAACLALAACFKWHPAIFAAPFAARRDLRFVLWTALAAVILLVLAPVLLLGFARTTEFYRALWLSYTDFDWVLTSYNTQYLPNVVRRLVDAVGIRVHPLSEVRLLTALRGLSWCVVIANLALVYLIQRRRLGRADLWSFHVLFLNIPFLFGTSWPVDLVFLPFAQTLLAWAILDGNGHPSAGSEALGPQRTVPAGLMVLLSMLFSNVVLFNVIGDRVVYGSLGYVFWADALCLIATYVLLVPQVLRGGGGRGLRTATPDI